MSKMIQLLIFVGLFVFSATAEAGVSIYSTFHTNSLGQMVITYTAISDGGPVATMGIHVQSSDGALGQVHPMGFDTPLQDYNAVFAGTPVDHDTQVMFATVADSLLVVPNSIDNNYELEISFTGIEEPFTNREVLQIVLTDPLADCFCSIGAVSDSLEYYTEQPCVPEPASMGLLVVGSFALMRRRCGA